MEIIHIESFFRLLTHGDASKTSVNLHVFASGCVRLRGLASNINLHTMRYEMAEKWVAQQEYMNSIYDKLVEVDRHVAQTASTKESMLPRVMDTLPQGLHPQVITAPPKLAPKPL